MNFIQNLKKFLFSSRTPQYCDEKLFQDSLKEVRQIVASNHLPLLWEDSEKIINIHKHLNHQGGGLSPDQAKEFLIETMKASSEDPMIEVSKKMGLNMRSQVGFTKLLPLLPNEIKMPYFAEKICKHELIEEKVVSKFGTIHGLEAFLRSSLPYIKPKFVHNLDILERVILPDEKHSKFFSKWMNEANEGFPFPEVKDGKKIISYLQKLDINIFGVENDSEESVLSAFKRGLKSEEDKIKIDNLFHQVNFLTNKKIKKVYADLVLSVEDLLRERAQDSPLQLKRAVDAIIFDGGNDPVIELVGKFPRNSWVHQVSTLYEAGMFDNSQAERVMQAFIKIAQENPVEHIYFFSELGKLFDKMRSDSDINWQNIDAQGFAERCREAWVQEKGWTEPFEKEMQKAQEIEQFIEAQQIKAAVGISKQMPVRRIPKSKI